MALGRFDAKSFAVEIEIESPGGSIASANTVEGELLGEIAVRLRLITIPEPILPGNRHVQQGGTQVNEGYVEPRPLKVTIDRNASRHPRRRSTFRLRPRMARILPAGFVAIFFEILGGK